MSKNVVKVSCTKCNTMNLLQLDHSIMKDIKRIKCVACGFEYDIKVLFAPEGLGEDLKPDPERLN